MNLLEMMQKLQADDEYPDFAKELAMRLANLLYQTRDRLLEGNFYSALEKLIAEIGEGPCPLPLPDEEEED